MLRKIILLALFFVILFYAALSFLINPFSYKAIELLRSKSSDFGFQIHKIEFERSRVSSPVQLSWSDVMAQVSFQDKNFFLADKTILISAETMTIRLKNLQKRKFGLIFKDLTLQISDQDENDLMEYIEGQNFEIKFQLDSMSPQGISQQAQNWAKGLSELLIDGKTRWPITFSGATYVNVKGKPARVRLSVHPEGDHYSLNLYRPDLNELAKRLSDKVTDAEIELISRYPLRAPALLKISDYATIAAVAANKKQPAVSPNCYRHVIWNYLLTKQFGAEFAKKFTDAHEAAFVDHEGDRATDLRNNEVGRSYALEGIPEASVLPRLLTDPRAVLNAREWPKMRKIIEREKK